ncbi:MAG: hypothetical protein NTX33_00505 [Propionibacteriales bacterium]|nr:hypothetical protein [Propionibacteriales bacterium]
MRSRSGLTLAVALLVIMGVGLVALSPRPAQADGACNGAWVETPPGSGIKVCVTAPGNPGGGGGGGQNGGGGPVKCYDQEKEIPCGNGLGVWFSDPGCYAAPMAPQPPADSANWEGHNPKQGSIYTCLLTPGIPFQNAYFFVANGAAPLPDPRVLAQRALDQLSFETPNIEIAPAPPLATYVGLETWLWIAGGQWRDLSLTVTVGNTSVTVVAAPKRVDWDLTAGTTSCYSAGREWVKGMSGEAKTDCSYTFSKLSDGQPDEQFPITATLMYSATWTCTGACTLPNGDLGDVPSLPGQAAIEVKERQSVIKNRP